MAEGGGFELVARFYKRSRITNFFKIVHANNPLNSQNRPKGQLEVHGRYTVSLQAGSV
jgi:hypothetical protein